MEGTWLKQECSNALITQGYKWRNLISIGHEDPDEGIAAPPSLKGFSWNMPKLRAKLIEVKKTTAVDSPFDGRYGDSWAAVFGRFETRRRFKFVRFPGELVGDGFGHLNWAAAQLVTLRDGSLTLAGAETR